MNDLKSDDLKYVWLFSSYNFDNTFILSFLKNSLSLDWLSLTISSLLFVYVSL